MSKPKIKFKLIKLERALVFQVLEQDSRFTSERMTFEYRAANGFYVKSSSVPQITSCSVYIRGDQLGIKFLPVSITFVSNEERDGLFARIIEALRDWSQNAPQFAEDKVIQNSAEADTYIF